MYGVPFAEWPPAQIGETPMTTQFKDGATGDMKLFVEFTNHAEFETKYQKELRPRLTRGGHAGTLRRRASGTAAPNSAAATAAAAAEHAALASAMLQFEPGGGGGDDGPGVTIAPSGRPGGRRARGGTTAAGPTVAETALDQYLDVYGDEGSNAELDLGGAGDDDSDLEL